MNPENDGGRITQNGPWDQEAKRLRYAQLLKHDSRRMIEMIELSSNLIDAESKKEIETCAMNGHKLKYTQCYCLCGKWRCACGKVREIKDASWRPW